MLLRSIAASAAALLFLTASGPLAAADAVQTTYDAVDSFDVSYADSLTNQLQITGVVHGESAASTRQFLVSSTGPATDACQRAFLVALNRPGRFSVTVGQPYANAHVIRCTLNRLP